MDRRVARHGKLLLVDDSLELLEAAQMALEELGVEVEVEVVVRVVDEVEVVDEVLVDDDVEVELPSSPHAAMAAPARIQAKNALRRIDASGPLRGPATPSRRR